MVMSVRSGSGFVSSVLFVGALVLGCDPDATLRRTASASSAAETNDAGQDAGDNDVSCPRQWGFAYLAAERDVRDPAITAPCEIGLTCEYPEGRGACVSDGSELGTHWTWWGPRRDDCSVVWPGSGASFGDACAEEGLTCWHYPTPFAVGSAGQAAEWITCEDGTWRAASP